MKPFDTVSPNGNVGAASYEMGGGPAGTVGAVGSYEMGENDGPRVPSGLFGGGPGSLEHDPAEGLRGILIPPVGRGLPGKLGGIRGPGAGLFDEGAVGGGSAGRHEDSYGKGYGHAVGQLSGGHWDGSPWTRDQINEAIENQWPYWDRDKYGFIIDTPANRFRWGVLNACWDWLDNMEMPDPDATNGGGVGMSVRSFVRYLAARLGQAGGEYGPTAPINVMYETLMMQRWSAAMSARRMSSVNPNPDGGDAESTFGSVEVLLPLDMGDPAAALG